MTVRCRVLCTLALGSVAPSWVSGQQPRPMVVSDLFDISALRRASISPDGQWIAITVNRGGAAGSLEMDGGDIWLIPRQGGVPSNLTKGAADRRSSWNPTWSPHGTRLAFLANQGGDNAELYVWERRSGAIDRISERGVDLLGATGEEWPARPILWLDENRILLPVVAEGTLSRLLLETPRKAVRAWATRDEGLRPSVSVLESGRDALEDHAQRGQLLLIDLATKRSQAVADGDVREILVSPTNKQIAVIVDVGRIPYNLRTRVPYSERFPPWTRWRTRLGILTLDREPRMRWISSVYDPLVTMGRPIPHAWSPDGSSFAVLAKERPDQEYPTTLFVVSPSTGAARVATDQSLDVSAAAWSSDGTLLAHARRTAISRAESDTSRFDWWRVDGHATLNPTLLSGTLASVPPVLMRAGGHKVMVGLAAGDLWGIDPRTGAASNLTAAFEPRLDAIVWPTAAALHSREQREWVMRAADGALYRVWLVKSSAQSQPFAVPSPTAEILDYQRDPDLVTFAANEPDGTYLWTGNGATPAFDKRVTLNEQLRGIASAKRVLVDYWGMDGQPLKALLALPIGYEPGKRYPTVVWVYGGSVIEDTAYSFLDKNDPHPLNLNLIPAHGFALLIPSMPLAPPEQPSDPLIDLPKGVMGAIDAAVQADIVDPDRIGVMGQSYGGYSTYGLVSFTTRFKAAVALAGLDDLISLYGVLPADIRYGQTAHQEGHQFGLAESGQWRMGAAPWQDLGRYLRNSPYFLVDRVETPLMIIHGDMDYVPMEQAEEFFSALNRMGKRATLVRYWGEGHVIYSPPNVADMWRRVLDWFDEYLKRGSSR